MNRIFLMYALVYLLISPWAISADYYVDANSGVNDTAPGRGESAGMPWKSITYALVNIPSPDAGHTIFVGPGEYTSSFESFSLSLGINMSLIGSGSDSTILNALDINRIITVTNSTGEYYKPGWFQHLGFIT